LSEREIIQELERLADGWEARARYGAGRDRGEILAYGDCCCAVRDIIRRARKSYTYDLDGRGAVEKGAE
jgi:hypothetical protein